MVPIYVECQFQDVTHSNTSFLEVKELKGE